MFLDPRTFDFVADLESEWTAIRDECLALPDDETRPWRDGETLIFDDTVQHEAWNRSKEPRIVLLFDFVRPGCEGVPQDVPPPKVRAMIPRWAR